jgi:hypothetical protein
VAAPDRNGQPGAAGRQRQDLTISLMMRSASSRVSNRESAWLWCPKHILRDGASRLFRMRTVQ